MNNLVVNKLFITRLISIGFVLLTTLAVAKADGFALSRYDVILERAPFGALPPKEDPEEAKRLAEEAAAKAAEQLVAEDYVPPSFEKIRVNMISTFKGIPAAGFTDMSENASYYLRKGEEFEGYTLVDVDYGSMRIKLKKGMEVADLPIWINPATTNMADISTFGTIPSGAPGIGATRVNDSSKKIQTLSAEEQEVVDERKRRREEWRKKQEEERQRRREELAAMTPEEREKHLREVNMNLIRTGNGPPLPIELNEEEMRQLAEEGFAVPGVNVPEDNNGHNMSPPPHGRRGSFPRRNN